MKKTILKFAVGILAVVIGITIVWASGIFQNLFSSTANSPASIAEIFSTQQIPSEKSGRIIVRFKEFHYGKWWFAYFEVINDTPNSIFYVGSSRGNAPADYCSLSVRQKEQSDSFAPFKVLNKCHYSKVDKLQTLKSGESVIFQVNEDDIRDLLNIKGTKAETRAQFGFEFFVEEEKLREILWSEEITFPFDKHR